MQDPASILIVKTSSLGDIIQAFDVLPNLHARFPCAAIDWAVEAPLAPIVAAHPLIRKPISINRRHPWNSFRRLRQEKYDLLFDLQGNCKSGLITFLARSPVKVGYALQSVREWPNILATTDRFNVSKQKNIRLYYRELIEQYFQKPALAPDIRAIQLKITPQEEDKIAHILSRISTPFKIMVCPGSKWINKQLPLETLAAFLQKISRAYNASFLLVWGNSSEKSFCDQIQLTLPHSLVVDKLSLPAWQNLMSKMDLVIAVDSSALHLCGMTATPTFSIFGPTSPNVFKPIGPQHLAIQGPCPYNRTFAKQCPLLRTCPTGSCIRNLRADELFTAFTTLRPPAFSAPLR